MDTYVYKYGICSWCIQHDIALDHAHNAELALETYPMEAASFTEAAFTFLSPFVDTPALTLQTSMSAALQLLVDQTPLAAMPLVLTRVLAWRASCYQMAKTSRLMGAL
jgi:hypothetical protein